MKLHKYLFLFALLFTVFAQNSIQAQNVTITDDSTHIPHGSAMLDVYSLSKGFLMPKLTTSQRLSIASPATGLMVFDTDSNHFYFHNGTSWENLMSITDTSSGFWKLNASARNLFMADSLNKVGIGYSKPSAKLEVWGDTLHNATDTVPLFSVKDRKGNEVFVVYPKGVRVYVDTSVFSTAKTNVTTDVTGFRVGKKTGSGSKGNGEEYFTISPDYAADTFGSQARILWYPKKEAFISGRVWVQSPDSVGTNSWASGYHSKSIGNYSQALGYSPRAIGDYSTAIGNYALAIGDNSCALGDSAVAGGGGGSKAANNYCYAFGKGTHAIGDGSYAFGRHAYSSGAASFALGENAYSAGNGSYAIGSMGIDTAGQSLYTPTYALGDFSFAMGLGARADSLGSFSLGVGSRGQGVFSFSAGIGSLTSGKHSIALGSYCTSSGYGSLAVGNAVTATQGYSAALGARSRANGYGALALGIYAYADSAQSISVGYMTEAKAPGAMAIGESSEALGASSIAIGRQNEATGDFSMAIGWQSVADSSLSVAVGYNNYSRNESSTVVGNSSIASGVRSSVFGSFCSATGYGAAAVGYSSHSTADNALTFGTNCQATRQGAVAIGFQNRARGTGAFAGGGYNYADSSYSVVFGQMNYGYGNYSFVNGISNTASGAYSTAIGGACQSKGLYSMAFGNNNISTGDYSFAFGQDATTGASYAFSFGWETSASNSHSMAFGYRTQATSQHAFALGSECFTSQFYSLSVGRKARATGYTSVAAGYYSEAKGQYSSAFGQNLLAKAQNCFVVGRFNDTTGTYNSWITTEPLFIVGNGSSSSSLSNAFTVLKNGQVKISGGSPGSGKILTSDANGLASWESFPAWMSGGSTGQTLRHDGTNWTANSLIYNTGTSVGIGTTSPNHTLTVRADAEVPMSLHRYSTANGDYTGMLFKVFGGVTNAYYKAGIFFQRTTTGGRGSLLFATDDESTTSNADTADIRMAITRGGYVGINTTNPVTILHVNHPNATSNGFSISNAYDSDRWHFYMYTSNDLYMYFNGSQRGSFNSTSGAYTALSDRRFKKNIHATDALLDKLMELQVVEYNFTGQTDAKKYIGLIAQDVESVFPSLVNHSSGENGQETDVYTLDYSATGVIAIKAIQEQQEIIRKQQQQIDELKQKYEELLQLLQHTSE